MADGPNSLLSFLTLFLVLLSCGSRHVDGRILKSITLSEEDDDVIDCIDIYKQPAFDHPLLKNHTIQMKPSSSPSGIRGGELFSNTFEKLFECPEGSVPIRRHRTDFPPKVNPFAPQATRLNFNNSFLSTVGHEYANVEVRGGRYFGSHAMLNAWQPLTSGRDISISQLWVTAGPYENLNTVEAGWIANNKVKDTTIFVYWTRDGYENTGCYNLNCPGFVITNRAHSPGFRITPLSTFNGEQRGIALTIHKDKKSGNWWVELNGEAIGYWPGSIFTSLQGNADRLIYGGEISNSNPDGHHTTTQMGSGHFAEGGFKKAAFVGNIQYIDESGKAKDPESLISTVTNPACYNLKIAPRSSVYGTHFYFGGPGYSDKCP